VDIQKLIANSAGKVNVACVIFKKTNGQTKQKKQQIKITVCNMIHYLICESIMLIHLIEICKKKLQEKKKVNEA